jgi:hypothetical protein
MQIGSVPDPRKWDRWPEAEALLEPARSRGDFPSVLDEDEVLFAVMEGEDLLAVATASRRRDNATGEIYVEVTLIGGRDHRRWLAELDKVIGAAATEAGATRMIGIGRAGWAKSLKRMGWERIRAVEDHWLYARELKERG